MTLAPRVALVENGFLEPCKVRAICRLQAHSSNHWSGCPVDSPAECHGCGLRTPEGYSAPGAGFCCSIGCVETELFGTGHCRWCGRDVDKTYTTIDSRLCSEDCAGNYCARVRGDRSAACGTGVRLAAFLVGKGKPGPVGLLGRKHGTLADRRNARREANRLAMRARRTVRTPEIEAGSPIKSAV
jgi:hypothetical protein